MTSNERTLFDTLHEAIHRVPGVPVHRERSAGHQGAVHHHGGTGHASTTRDSAPGRTGNHSPARPPRVLLAWQRRIAALFGQEL